MTDNTHIEGRSSEDEKETIISIREIEKAAIAMLSKSSAYESPIIDKINEEHITKLLEGSEANMRASWKEKKRQ